MKYTLVMKHFFILFSIFLISSSITWGQQFGIHAGGNISYLTSKVGSVYGKQTGHKVGFSGGIDYNYQLSNNLSLQPELNYDYFRGEDNLLAGNYKLSLLSLPLLIKYIPSRSRIGIYAGPQYSYFLSAQSLTNENPSYRSWTDGVKKSVWSGIVGGEYSIKLKTGNFIVPSFRYLFNLSDWYKYAPMSYSGTGKPSLKNKAIIFTVGYRF
ncbi:MAG: outer membrane beta-barrel protein [Chitinophagaceae bacterium]